MNLYLLLKKVIFRWPTFSKLLFIINFYTNLLLNNVEALIYCRLNLQPCYLQPFILFLYFTNLLYFYFFVAKKQKKVLYSDILHINNNKLHINWTEKKMKQLIYLMICSCKVPKHIILQIYNKTMHFWDDVLI